MSDLSQVSTDELLRAYRQPQGDLSGVSTEDLLKAYRAPQGAPQGSQQQLTADQLLAAQQRRQDGGELSWSDVPGQMLANLPGSAAQFGSDIIQPFIHPIDTLSAIGDAGHGLAQKLGLASGTDDVAKADAIGQFFADRYGSMEGFKRALATDPVGVAGDLSTVLSGGSTALARAPGVAGRAAKVAGIASKVVDPLTLPTLAGTGTLKTAAHVLGTSTGAYGAAVDAARLAGKEGGEASAALRDQMRRNAPIEELVDDAHSALDNMRQANLALIPSRGASSAADWAANKQIALPDARGCVFGSLDDMGAPAAGRLTAAYFGTAATVLGARGGSESNQITLTQLPTLAFSGTTGNDAPDHTHPYTQRGGGLHQDGTNQYTVAIQDIAQNTGGASTRHQHPFSGAIPGTGNQPHANVQPTLLVTAYLKL
ncbi:hypothetical protein [Bradyrhizobium sp. 1(2017)]|uniref:hypothetical protein n=1 Tax=Bradyrhizobium sp. 1(2017) TaxID=1404888 RepID=UPI00140F2C58|nr:hypothetical protein [Bradyrhizobium sp. 1(2017)]QIO34328.1 hypothetical protein HAP40_22290 [Bradyrhizobium sp. 1(2017)]